MSVFLNLLLEMIAFFLTIGIFLIILGKVLARSISNADRRLEEIENDLNGYKSYGYYLPLSRRETSEVTLNQATKFLKEPLWPFVSREQNKLADSCRQRANELKGFLEGYTQNYVEHNVKQHKDFFQDKQLDQEQIASIVKDDLYNLAIAAAGSGKTRVLTTRIAYLTRRNVSPEKLLVLAYTNRAVEEMQRRLNGEYGVSVDVHTFHSFGRKVLKTLWPEFRSGIADEEHQREHILETFNDLLSQNKSYAKALLEYSNSRSEPDVEDFDDAEKYYRYLVQQQYTTLNSIRVKSIAERDIANFLFLNQAEFKYEPIAKWADRSREFRQYQPDFYLPKYEIYIEHWAVDKAGNVPHWFDLSKTREVTSRRYSAQRKWKLKQFHKYRRELIQTFYYQWADGSLIEQLEQQLRDRGVELRELGLQELIKKVGEYIPHKNTLVEFIINFINTAKSSGLGIPEIKTKLQNDLATRKQRRFANLVLPVWERYETWLRQNDMVDFNDMINYALRVAREQKDLVKERYSHILIDEFQDITSTQLELIKCFVSENGDTKLFCVGDDWQNIFSFAGSNVEHIVHFEEHFPCPEVTPITTNYRCPKNIVEAANSSISNNKSKVPKKVRASSEQTYPIEVYEIPRGHGEEYDNFEFQASKNLIEELLRKKEKDETIMVLSRFNFRIKSLELEFPNPSVRFLSVHKAKGTEADYVILLGCVRGLYGFPSEVNDANILDLARSGKRSQRDRYEEERRLFYVALTRCKKRLFLFTSSKSRSPFLKEIELSLTFRPCELLLQTYASNNSTTSRPI
ncbi:MAG: UvrD-helicase domain-containing protein [Thaumarchaeota archaeon]|nr:UvrD-helicase domain-containing protein [Nitrososphaerota archaeon]